MKQEHFIQSHSPQWKVFEAHLDHLEGPGLWRSLKGVKTSPPASINIPEAYRNICHHLALAQARQYSPLLINQLNQLVIRGHQHLYKTAYSASFIQRIKAFYLWQLPQLVRKEWRGILASCLLFYLPFFMILIGLGFVERFGRV